MRSVADSSDVNDVTIKLQEIATHILNRWRMRCALNATGNAMDNAVMHTQKFLEDLKAMPVDKLTYDSFLTQVKLLYILSLVIPRLPSWSVFPGDISVTVHCRWMKHHSWIEYIPKLCLARLFLKFSKNVILAIF